MLAFSKAMAAKVQQMMYISGVLLFSFMHENESSQHSPPKSSLLTLSVSSQSPIPIPVLCLNYRGRRGESERTHIQT